MLQPLHFNNEGMCGCGEQLLTWLPANPSSWCSHFYVTASPCIWAGPNDLLLMSRKWQKRWAFACVWVAGIHSPCTLLLTAELERLCGEAPVARTWGSPQPTTHEKQAGVWHSAGTCIPPATTQAGLQVNLPSCILRWLKSWVALRATTPSYADPGELWDNERHFKPLRDKLKIWIFFDEFGSWRHTVQFIWLHLSYKLYKRSLKS